MDRARIFIDLLDQDGTSTNYMRVTIDNNNSARLTENLNDHVLAMFQARGSRIDQVTLPADCQCQLFSRLIVRTVERAH
jgi:hypothetical protein